MRNAMKKFVAVVLTFVMVLSMATVAFANPGWDPNAPGRDPDEYVSLTIQHYRQPFAPPGFPAAPGVGPGGLTPSPSMPGQAVVGSEWAAVRVQAPPLWNGLAIPAAVEAAILGMLPLGAGPFVAPIQVPAQTGWFLTSTVATATTGTTGVAVFPQALTLPSTAVPNAPGASHNGGLGSHAIGDNIGQGMWMVWETTTDPDITDPDDITSPFLVSLPTFVHDPVLVRCATYPACAPNCTDCYYVDGWVYHVRVFPKQNPPPRFVKGLLATQPRSEIVHDDDCHLHPDNTPNDPTYTICCILAGCELIQYTYVDWRFRFEILADLGHIGQIFHPQIGIGGVYQEVAVPFSPNVPIALIPGRPVPGPAGLGGYGPGGAAGRVPVNAQDFGRGTAGLFHGPDTVAQPLTGSHQWDAGTPVFVAIRDVLDSRFRLQENTVAGANDYVYSFVVTYQTQLAQVAPPLPAVFEELDRVDSGNENWIVIAETVGGVQTFWIYFTEYGRDHIYEYGVLGGDVRIDFRVRADITDPSDIGVVENVGTLYYGARTPFDNEPPDPPDDEDDPEYHNRGVRITKVNPDDHYLDGAVFYLFRDNQIEHYNPATGNILAYNNALLWNTTGAFPVPLPVPAGYVTRLINPQDPPARAAVSGGDDHLGLNCANCCTTYGPVLPIAALDAAYQQVGRAVFVDVPTPQEGVYRYWIMERLAPPGGYRRIIGLREVQLGQVSPLLACNYYTHDIANCNVAGCVPGSPCTPNVACGDPCGPGAYDCNWVTFLIELRVTNTRDFYLPLTGGAGTIMFTAAGVSLMGGAGLFLFLSRKKEKVRK